MFVCILISLCFLRGISDTEAKLNFATLSDLSVEGKDKIHGSNDIWILIGCMIDTIRNTGLDIYQNLVRKNQMKQEPDTVSDTPDVDMSTMPCRFAFSWPNVWKLYSRQRQKWTVLAALKEITCETFTGWKWPILFHKTSKQLQFVWSPISCLLFLTVLRAQSFYIERFFGTPNTLLTLSHSKHYIVTHYFLKCCCFFFRPMFNNSAFFRTRS